MDSSRVSAVIPVYNGALYIEEALASVYAQTHQPYEIIVVDDGSVDDSAAIAERAGVRCIRRAHEGAAAARNAGVQAATGDYIAFLDADDVWMPAKTVLQLGVLRGGKVDMVFGQVQQFGDAAGEYPVEQGYSAGAMLVRRSDFLRVGWFSTEWMVGEFIDWYARATELGLQSALVPELVLRRRLHSDNLGVRERSAQVDYTRVLRAALQRRRNSNDTSIL